MRRALFVLGSCLFGVAVGAAAVLLVLQKRTERPDPAAVISQVREVARLETLELTLYKKISFSPEPTASDSLWKDVAHWVVFSLRKPEGRAIVFARARIGLDLRRLDPSSVRIVGQRIELQLPPMSPEVELLPGETEIIGSNLDSAETAKLFEHAREAFLRELERDPEVQERARASAKRSLHALLVTLGFREVVFIDRNPGPNG